MYTLDKSELLRKYHEVRSRSETICSPLAIEDHVVQPIEDVSPPKWHLAHTTWFFEQLVLDRFQSGYVRFHPDYYFLFNSYYQSLGNRWNRSLRGVLSRPTVAEVTAYRDAIDNRMENLISGIDEGRFPDLAEIVTLGLNHEQQHQELLVTDIKNILGTNPLRPAYAEGAPDESAGNGQPPESKFVDFEGGVLEIGSNSAAFSYDNERPRHRTLIQDFSLMNRPVTCGEFLEFINDGGYEDADLWLSDGWDWLVASGCRQPLYWESGDGQWRIMTLRGLKPLNENEPVCHVSFYEAAAYARWRSCRLPSEAEWETAASRTVSQQANGNFLESESFHPRPLGQSGGDSAGAMHQMFGDVWEWTGSAYLPYPGYVQEAGPLGEYNGKFMNNQMVLRGGSCATPKSHIRPTYRNFFQGDKQWQFTGIRLAKDI